MKKIILLGSILLTLSGFAQDAVQELNCYNKWAAKFEERGAEDVKDGIYTDVIISTREGAKATCNNGKVEVVNGVIVKIYLLLDDGSYEELKRSWKNNSNMNVKIINGISGNMLTTYNQLINVLWPKKIKPKKAKASIAAEPTDD
jgi:hypothetical protein